MSSKARMFNRQASNSKSKSDEILKALSLQLGQKVADVGAGGGYFSFRFAELVGIRGHVYALDTDSGKLDFIRKMIEEKGLGNIDVVLVGKEGVTLPERVDLIFMRNVYHHISNRVEYFAKLKSLLRSSGQVAIVEHEGGGCFHSLFEHRVSGKTVVEEMNLADYIVVRNLDFLSKQSFTIFSPK